MEIADIEEIFQSIGPVRIRRMFGGKGIYHDDKIRALEVGGDILLKVDAVSVAAFEAAGSRQWTYDGKGKPVRMPYWSIPDSAFDDPAEMADWVALAKQASMRAK